MAEMVVVVEGSELAALIETLKEGTSVRFAVDGGGLKVSVNQRMWTLPFGEEWDRR